MPQHDTHLLSYLEAVKRLQGEHVSIPVYRPEGHLEHGGEHVEGVLRIQDLSLESQPREKKKKLEQSIKIIMKGLQTYRD